MASKKEFVDIDMQVNELINLKSDTLDISTNQASNNSKRIVFYNGQYYYSNGVSWIPFGGSLIDLKGGEVWRGNTFRNNSTTIDTTAGIVLSTNGTNTARSVTTSSFATRSIRLGVTASVTSTGRYSGMRGSSLLWYLTGGFLYVGDFNISDTATATGTHNFWGLASSTSDLAIELTMTNLLHYLTL